MKKCTNLADWYRTRAVLNKEISNKLITLNIKTQNTKNKPSFQTYQYPQLESKHLL